MHGVIKILLFLFTSTQQILGSRQVLEHFPTCEGSQLPHPIATDWEMHHHASSVIGTTNTSRTEVTSQPHHSGMSLHLTDPNLDPPVNKFTCSLHRILLRLHQSHITFDWHHTLPSPSSTKNLRGFFNNSSVHIHAILSHFHELSTNEMWTSTKFKNKMVFSNFTVKTPPPTWHFVCFEINLPIGEFFIFTISQSFSMNQKIPSFSSMSIDDNTSSSPMAQTKSSKFPRFRSFNHDPTELVQHRDDRCFRSKQVWIQGLPPDPSQAEQIVRHVASVTMLPISAEAIVHVGDHIRSLNNKSRKGTGAPLTFGSTATSHAVVVPLSEHTTFSAVPGHRIVSTVTELVVRTSSHLQENTTTIVVVPWLLEDTTELTTLLRFHHMAMDAKSELVHAIYHQLSALPAGDGSHSTQLQFIARIVTSDKPLWVIDLIGPLNFSTAVLNNHFMGNPAGDTTTIELDGIPMQVIGGYGISNAALPGFSHPPLIWANLPITQPIPLRYLQHLLAKMGCAEEGTVSILYAKAESLRTHSKSRRDRMALTQKATAPVSPTIIFATQRHLKYFLDHFATFVANYLPPLMIGHSSEPLPKGTTVEEFNGSPTPLIEFMQTQTLKRYLSDVVGERHRTLTILTPEDVGKIKVDHFAMADRSLARAQKELSAEEFQAGLTSIGRKYWPLDTEASLALALQHLGDISSRSQSPGKRRATDLSEQTTPKVANRQRRSEAFAKEREDALLDLDYTYVPMDTGKS